jgi:hypothetical protein
MPNVIDSLVLELGLDSSKFTQSQKDALAALRKFEEQSVRSGKTAEAQGARFESFFKKLKLEALALAAGLLGAKGIKDFVTNVTTLDASVGRASKTLNMGTRELSAWQGVARQTGSTNEAMTGTLQGLTDEMNKIAVGIPSNILPVLNYLQIDFRKANGDLKTAGELMFDLNRAVQGMDPARARVVLSQLGIPPDVINTLLLGRDSLRTLYDEQVRIGLITKEDADRAIELQGAWNKAATAATALGRVIVNDLSPYLTSALNSIARFLSVPDRHGIAHKAKPAAPAAEGVPVAVKPDAGSASPATSRVMAALAGVPGIERVTALNDAYHAFLGGAHPAGRAVDLTVKDPSQSEAVAAAIRARLAEAGIQGTVLNEYTNPSRRSTAPHLHIQVNPPSPGQVGAPAAALGSSTVNRGGDTNTTTSSVSVGTVVIHAEGRDADAIANSIVPAIRRNALANHANSGQQ